MDLIDLRNRIIAKCNCTKEEKRKLSSLIDRDTTGYPFNPYELAICFAINKGWMTYRQYVILRNKYLRKNKNLSLFEISAPRKFGETFAQDYLIEKSNFKLQKATKDLDPYFDDEYDLYMEEIKIEVKASRAVDRASKKPLYMKALYTDTDKNFNMNFQQLKPQCCDVFIWLGIFRDDIMIWVLSSKTVQEHELFSGGQHRGNKGNEGQLHIQDSNIKDFDKYLLGNKELDRAIRKANKENASS